MQKFHNSPKIIFDLSSDETSEYSDLNVLHGISGDSPTLGKMQPCYAKDLLFSTMVDNESSSDSASDEED